jgi:hypothetical protein
MAVPTDISTGVQTVTATGAVTATAGVSVSAVTGDFALVLEIVSLTASKTCRIQFEDSTNAFTNSAALAVVDVIGLTQGQYSKRYTFRKQDLQNSQFGVAAGVVRANVTAIDGSATLQLHAWYEA